MDDSSAMLSLKQEYAYIHLAEYASPIPPNWIAKCRAYRMAPGICRALRLPAKIVGSHVLCRRSIIEFVRTSEPGPQNRLLHKRALPRDLYGQKRHTGLKIARHAAFF